MPDINPTQNYTWQRHDLLKHLCVTAKNIWTPTVIARTKTQKMIGGYRASLPHCGDLEMWLRFAANGPVAYINVTQAIYRTHSMQMSKTYSADIMVDFCQTALAFDSFFDEYQSRLDNPRGLRLVARRALARRILVFGMELLVRTRLNEGWRLIRAAVDMDPRLRYRPPALWVLRKMASKARARLRQNGT
jgi:hypothetical protein